MEQNFEAAVKAGEIPGVVLFATDTDGTSELKRKR